MNQLLLELKGEIMKYLYNEASTNYAEDADRLLLILDKVTEIEDVTELHNVCDSMRDDIGAIGCQSHYAETMMSMQSFLHTINDLKACAETMRELCRITWKYQTGRITYDEYKNAVNERLHVTLLFEDVKDFTYSEIWEMFH